MNRDNKLFLARFLKRIADTLTGICVFIKKRLPEREVRLEKKRILINRADRIGDAFISMPLFFALSEQFDITIVTSEYNDWVLKPFFKTIPIKMEFKGVLDDFLKRKIIVLKSHIRSCWLLLKRHFQKEFEYDIYFDMVGDLRMLPDYIERCRHLLGPERYFCLYYDRTTSGFEENGKHILRNYLDLLESSGIAIRLDGKAFRKTIEKIDSFLEKVEAPEIEGDYILVSMGCKEYRNLPEEMWEHILRDLKTFAEDKGIRIVVMDDIEKRLIGSISSKLGKNRSIIYIKEDISLWQRYLISKKALLYVGVDAGPSHLLQLPTNALVIFTLADPAAWKPYATDWRIEHVEKGNVLERAMQNGLKKAVIYSDVGCRSCSGVGCSAMTCIKGLEPSFISRSVIEMSLEIMKKS